MKGGKGGARGGFECTEAGLKKDKAHVSSPYLRLTAVDQGQCVDVQPVSRHFV